jgi:hypothetical protein
MGHQDRRSASLEDLSALYQAKKMESIRHLVDSDVIYLLISDPEVTELVTINGIHFIVDQGGGGTWIPDIGLGGGGGSARGLKYFL